MKFEEFQKLVEDAAGGSESEQEAALWALAEDLAYVEVIAKISAATSTNHLREVYKEVCG